MTPKFIQLPLTFLLHPFFFPLLFSVQGVERVEAKGWRKVRERRTYEVAKDQLHLGLLFFKQIQKCCSI